MPVTYGAYVKPFSWSYSKLKNYRNCPKKHYHVDVARDFAEGKSAALEEGNAIHKAMEERCRDGTPLPPAYRDYEKEAAEALAVTPEGTIMMVEEQAAIRDDFSACSWRDPRAWLRMKIDFAKVSGPIASLRDWKTGKINEESEQLALTAQWVFSKFPAVQLVVTRFVWLGNNWSTRVDFKREDMVSLWRGLLPEIQQYQEAVRTTTFPPRPSGLCRAHCPVTSCPHHGVGSTR
jgi:hypothetical protein